MKYKLFILIFLFVVSCTAAQDETHFCIYGSVYENELGQIAKGPIDKIGGATFRVYLKEERIEYQLKDVVKKLTFVLPVESSTSFDSYYLKDNNGEDYRLEIYKEEIRLYFHRDFVNGKSKFKKVAYWNCRN